MRILKILLLGLLLLIFGLPYGLKFGAMSYLENNYDVSVNIEKISLNPFTGKIGVKGLHIYGSNDQELHLGEILLQVNMRGLFDQKILINSFFAANFKTKITQSEKYWNLGGLEIPISDSVKTKPTNSDIRSSWQFGIDQFSLNTINVELDVTQFSGNVLIESLSINDIQEWQPDLITSLSAKLRVNNSPVSIKGEARPFRLIPDVKSEIKISNLDMASLMTKLEDKLNYEEIHGILNADFEMGYFIEKGQHNISTDGSLSVSDLAINDAINLIMFKAKKIKWDGEAEIKIPNIKDGLSLTSSSQLTLGTFEAISNEKNVVLASFDEFLMGNFSINEAVFDFKALEISGLKLLEEREKSNTRIPLIVNKLKIDQINIDQKILHVENVLVSGLEANLEIDQNGELLQTQFFRDEESKVSEEDNIEIASSSKESLVKYFSVNEIKIIDDSQVKFFDRSVTPVFESNLNKIELLVKEVDSQNGSLWAEFDLNAKLNDYGNIQLDGKIQPFSKKINALVSAKLKNIPLVPLSSYAGKYADLFIKRGFVDIDLKVSVTDDMLDVENTLLLSKLTLEPGSTEVSKKWLLELPMPLDVTLNALRNKNDEIKLSIPIDGNISSPDFDFQNIYNTAMLKAVKVAATFYITQAIQPLGLVLTASKLVGKAMQPSFEPLYFDVGSTILDNENTQHIGRVKNLLIKRPALKLTVCANAVEQDWGAVSKKTLSSDKALRDKQRTQFLLKLANDRSRLVKRLLVGKGQISPTRIFECNGKIEVGEKERPKVMLSL